MNSINQNLLKVHRTDSMDQIIDRLNAATGQITNSSGYINKFTLKLNDINKELEYNTNNNSTNFYHRNGLNNGVVELEHLCQHRK